MSLEEDVYTEIFSALKHPIRRRILKMLESEPHTYTALLNGLGIDTGLLNYHLDSLGSLIRKDEEGMYRISDFGLAAIGLTRRIEEPAARPSPEFKVFGRKFSPSLIWVIVVGVLMLTNLFAWTSYQYSESWFSERFQENVALAQNRVFDVILRLEDVLEDGKLDSRELEDLRSRVEGASVQAAKVTFLDRHHFDMWDRTCDSFGLFEGLLEDINTVVKARDTGGETPVVLDEYSAERLRKVLNDLRDFYEWVFPGNVEEGNPWAWPRYSSMDDALAKLERFQGDVARTWLVVPVLSEGLIQPPEERARSMLVDAVGLDYFDRYFELMGVFYNSWEPENWLTQVAYFYHIEVGNYTATREVNFWFDKMNRFLRSEGVPAPGNLMPFNISQQQAIEIALGNMTREFVEVEADISYIGRPYNGSELAEYVWSVVFYHAPKSSPTGRMTRVLVDPYSGEVLDVSEVSWIKQP